MNKQQPPQYRSIREGKKKIGSTSLIKIRRSKVKNEPMFEEKESGPRPQKLRPVNFCDRSIKNNFIKKKYIIHR